MKVNMSSTAISILFCHNSVCHTILDPYIRKSAVLPFLHEYLLGCDTGNLLYREQSN